MEKSVDKIMTVSFIIGAALCYYVINVILNVANNFSGTIANITEPTAVRHGVPIGAAVIFFFYTTFNKNVRAWANEVILEVAKVVWPSKKDTYAMTIVVTFLMILSGIILGIFDKISLWIIQFIIEVL